MQTHCTQRTFQFQGLDRRAVGARFDGGPITSDAGGLLLREVEQHTGIIRQFAACFTDHRDEELIEHSVEELLRQRIFGLALGYEDLNDHDELRHDPLLATLVGKGGSHRRRSLPPAGSGQGLGRPQHAQPAGTDAAWSQRQQPLQENRC